MARTLRFTVTREDLAASPRLDQVLLRRLALCAAGDKDGAEEEAGLGDEDLNLDEETACPSQASALSREAVKKAVRHGLLRRGGAVCDQPSARLKPGETLEFTLPETSADLSPEEGPLTVVWQDSDLLVLAKPAGITVHPCPSCPSGTLIQRVAWLFPEVAAMGGLRPGIVHRLDKETSGLLLVARNEETRLALSRAFADRQVHKEYLAVVWGRLEDSGSMTAAIGRDPVRKTRMAELDPARGGREAATDYETLWRAPDSQASLARVRIHTGRTHQIRVHMTGLGHPLLGDALYCEGPAMTAAAMAPRVMLHAWKLSFTHPRTGEALSFRLRPPRDFEECLLERQASTQTLVLTGNPGCGKSTVSALLEASGCPVISADELVRGYYGPGGTISAWMERRWGPEMLASDGSLDRQKLMALFVRRPDERRELERLAHEQVKGDIRDFFRRCRREGRIRAAAEIPLYFECGWHKDVFAPAPLAVGIHAGFEVRMKRLEATRGWSEGKISAIESWQWEEERKMSACDLTLENGSTREELEKAVCSGLIAALDALATSAAESFRAWLESLWEDRTGTDR